MTLGEADTETLLDHVERGERCAVDVLLHRYRHRLRSLVSMRLDHRLASRIDPSDVVQDTLVKAAGRVAGYARDRPVPFYPWLRRLAMDRLVEAHRTHLHAQRRSVTREQDAVPQGRSNSGPAVLAERFAAIEDHPSEHVHRREQVERLRAAIDQLSYRDREVLILRFVEQLSTTEAAAVLAVSKNTLAQRQLRALQRVRALLDENESKS